MLALYRTISALMVAGDKVDVDAQDSTEISPQVSLEGIAVVADDGFTSPIACQPASDKGITTMK